MTGFEVRPAVETPDYIAGAVGAVPKAALKRLHCLAAALAVFLHAMFLFLGFWLGGATGGAQVRNLPQSISVSLNRWPSGEDAGEQNPALPERPALPPGSAAGKNRVSAPVGAEMEASEENSAQESGGLAGEVNRSAELAAGGISIFSQAAPGAGSGTAEGSKNGSPPEVLAHPLYAENPPPLYPQLARRMGKQGAVLLEVFVSASGTVEEVKVATGSGYEILDEAALNTVRGWRFAPGLRNGQPTAMRVRVPVRFELRG